MKKLALIVLIAMFLIGCDTNTPILDWDEFHVLEDRTIFIRNSTIQRKGDQHRTVEVLMLTKYKSPQEETAGGEKLKHNSVILLLSLRCNSYKIAFKKVRYLDENGNILHKEYYRKYKSITPGLTFDLLHQELCTNKN